MRLFEESPRKRLKRLAGRHARVDGIKYVLPINSTNSPALMSLYSIDAEMAKKFLVSDELHPLRLPNGRGVLVLTIIDYRETDIGKYIEYSIAIACTKGKRAAPRLIPALFMKTFKTGQCVIDLPVSTEISVKGGRGIWGMPKHQQSLNFLINEDTVSAQYDLDGELAVKVVIPKPKRYWVPVNVGAANYCGFRGMLMASYIYFRTKLGFTLGKRNKEKAKLIVGDHPRVQWLKQIDVAPHPFITAFLPTFEGNLDDHFESWFISKDKEIDYIAEGLECTYPLGYGEDWPPPPVDAASRSASEPANSEYKPGLGFSETMAGGFSLGETDPQAGEKVGKAKGNVLAMHATIAIDDIELFINDPEHCGSISGTIDFTPFGKGLVASSGQFNLFSPAENPSVKYMVYEMGFRYQGQDYYVAGKKEVKDDRGLDLWSDTTTLYTRLYEGTDSNGTQIGAGVLSLGIIDLMSMLTTFRTRNCTDAGQSAQCIASFGRFFLGELWDNYQATAKEERERDPV